MHRWTQIEIATLQRLWPTGSKVSLLACLPGRTWKGIKRRAANSKFKREWRLNGKPRPLQFVDKLPDWLVGEMLSDGHINPAGRYCHTTKHDGYADFICEKFDRLGLSTWRCRDERIDKRSGKMCRRTLVKSSGVFRAQRLLWYPNGKKCVPPMTKLGLEGLLHLLLGDGSCDSKRRMLRVSAMAFDAPSMQRLVTALRNIAIIAKPDKIGVLNFSRKALTARKTIKNMLEQFDIPPCYHYKRDAMLIWAS